MSGFLQSREHGDGTCAEEQEPLREHRPCCSSVLPLYTGNIDHAAVEYYPCTQMQQEEAALPDTRGLFQKARNSHHLAGNFCQI